MRSLKGVLTNESSILKDVKGKGKKVKLKRS